jgi:ABC-type nitrate/sulfonate/bicarbonate transport system substrate-binding protein
MFRPRLTRVALVAILAFAAFAPLALASPARQLTPVRQAGFKVLYMWPLFVAKEKGFFAEEGLDFEYLEVSSGPLGVASVVSGNAQFTDMGINDAANLLSEGREMLMVYRLMRRVTLNLVVRQEVVDRLGLSRDMPLADRYAALKGLNIGITQPGAVTDIVARFYLRQAGLDPDRDATIVPVGGASALAAALRTGRVDTYLLSPPTPEQLEQEGIGKIIIKSSAGDVPELSDVPFASITVQKDFADTNPDLIGAYVRAIKKAIAFGNANREEGLAIAQVYFPDTPPDVLALSWDALLPAISGEGTFTEEGNRSYLQILLDGGQLRGGMPPIEDGVLWTNRFVQ